MFGELNDKQREYLADIMSSSKTLLAIIDDILDLDDDRSGRDLQLKPSPVGVRAIIDAAILGIRERAVRSRLTIDIAVADDVTEFMADEARMRQVLYNLLSNAVGFSKVNGTVRLTCWREAGNIIFRVEDRRDRHPEGSDRPCLPALRKPQPRLRASRRRAWPFDRQKPRGAARRQHRNRLGGGPRHARDSSDSRTARRRTRMAARRGWQAANGQRKFRRNDQVHIPVPRPDGRRRCRGLPHEVAFLLQPGDTLASKAISAPANRRLRAH